MMNLSTMPLLYKLVVFSCPRCKIVERNTTMLVLKVMAQCYYNMVIMDLYIKCHLQEAEVERQCSHHSSMSHSFHYVANI